MTAFVLHTHVSHITRITTKKKSEHIALTFLSKGDFTTTMC